MVAGNRHFGPALLTTTKRQSRDLALGSEHAKGQVAFDAEYGKSRRFLTPLNIAYSSQSNRQAFPNNDSAITIAACSPSRSA
ncbi:MAG: hypothetical protein ACI8PT_001020 [Gammaproteobacteria bacterium]|jgi:hypothetical protein